MTAQIFNPQLFDLSLGIERNIFFFSVEEIIHCLNDKQNKYITFNRTNNVSCQYVLIECIVCVYNGTVDRYYLELAYKII